MPSRRQIGFVFSKRPLIISGFELRTSDFPPKAGELALFCIFVFCRARELSFAPAVIPAKAGMQNLSPWRLDLPDKGQTLALFFAPKTGAYYHKSFRIKRVGWIRHLPNWVCFFKKLIAANVNFYIRNSLFDIRHSAAPRPLPFPILLLPCFFSLFLSTNRLIAIPIC